MRSLREKLNESLVSVVPITLIVLILSMILVPMDTGTMLMFLFGSVFLIIGMGLFQLGAEISMTPMGEGVGVQISKSKSILTVIILSFLVGVIVTIAEPDLQVLANQVPSIPNNVLIWTVAVGVGVFLVVAILRIMFKVPLSRLLLIFYVLLFAITIFVPSDFLSVAFDAGGVTTGPITVPFIMAIGVGIASVRSDKDASDDSFGLVSLCSIGPILAVLILGLFYSNDTSYKPTVISEVETTQDVILEFAHGIPEYAKEVFVAILPIVITFFLMQLILRRYTRHQCARMLIGFGYTYVGLVLFLSGVNIGFMPVGDLFGSSIADTNYRWILVPLGMIIGYFIVKAEPAVQVLNNQVEDITNGAIHHKTMNKCLSIGVSISVGLSMLRVLTGMPIMYILIPGYIIAIGLTFVVPKIFVGIAFDSGGVCSGPMTTTFLLPLAMGASESIGGNVMTDAFGVVAMVAMTPLIAVQIMGLVFVIKERKAEKLSTADTAILEITDDITDSDDIIDYEEDSDDK